MIQLDIHFFLSCIAIASVCMAFFIIAKALTLDWKPRLKEFFFMIVSSLIVAVVILVNRAMHDVFSHILGDLTLILFLVLYLHKVKSYPLKKAIPLMMLSLVCVVVAELALVFSLGIIGVHRPLFFSSNFTYSIPIHTGYPIALRFLLPKGAFIAIFIALIIKFTKRPRKVINQNPNLQSTVMIFCIYCITFVAVVVNIWRALAVPSDALEPNFPFIFILMCILFAMFSIFTISKYSEHEKQQKDLEQKNLQHYIDSLEQQQASIVKFRHDYQNLLISMQSFMHDEDWEGLKKFYASAADIASSAIAESRSTFDYIHRIKQREVKSIISAKLLQAQNISEKIRVVFEANDTIDKIPVDSVVLVRMLGIILDNAIDALEELGRGTLFVSCLKWESGITFIVENTCPTNMPSLEQLCRPGFSTKGGKRGRGLSILSELIDACPNVMLDTTIEGGLFRQALLIETEEGGNG